MSTRPEVVDVLTRVDITEFARGNAVDTNGRPLTPNETDLVNGATIHEVAEARTILARRQTMHQCRMPCPRCAGPDAIDIPSHPGRPRGYRAASSGFAGRPDYRKCRDCDGTGYLDVGGDRE